MADARLQIVLEAVDKASATLRRSANDLRQMSQQARGLGIAFAAAGAAITGALALSVRAAEEQRRSIALLSQSLQNVGVSYAQNTQAIEGTIDALQRKTSFGDEEQREALTKLITTTQDYRASLSALPTTLDLAAGAGLSLESAALLVGRAMTGNTEMLGRYGIQLKEGATATEALAELTKRFAGAAEAAADPLKQLQNDIGNLMEEVGDALLPALRDIVGIIRDVIQAIMAWRRQNPELFDNLVKIAFIVGTLSTALGGIILLLPGLIAGLSALGIAFGLATGPIGLLILAIAGLGAAGFLLITQWETIKTGFLSLIDDMVNGARAVLNPVVRWLNSLPSIIRTVFGVIQDIPEIPLSQLAQRRRGIPQLDVPHVPSVRPGAEPFKPIKVVADEIASAQRQIGDSATRGFGEASDQINLYSTEMMFAREYMRTEFEQAMTELERAGLSAGDAFIIAAIQIGDVFTMKLEKMADTAKNGQAVLKALRDGIIDVATAIDVLQKGQMAPLPVGGWTLGGQPLIGAGVSASWQWRQSQEAQAAQARTMRVTGYTADRRPMIQVILNGKVIEEYLGDAAVGEEQVRSS